jgi:hypothetical protein
LALAVWLAVVVGCCGSVASGTYPADEEEALRRAAETITAGDLKRHAFWLADDALEGRAAGTRGGRAAAHYLARQLQRLGIEPAGSGGSYFQSFGADYRNVLGLLPGSDPQLSHEVVIVAAHYDHVGYGTSQTSNGPIGYIHNGADDNASGTAAVLEIAEALVHARLRPRRSVLVAFWDAEEIGLLGSKHWVAQPTVELSRVRVMFNLDMIGRLRDERLEVVGVRTAAGLRRFATQANEAFQLRLDFPWTLTDDSDHYPLYQQGIPVVMLHTGLHEEYHRPSDDAHLLNLEGMQRISRFVFRLAYDASNRQSWPAFREACRRENAEMQRRVEQPLPPLPGRLGISWDPHDAGPGVRVVQVAAGSPGEVAGLRVGDRLLQFNGEPIADGQSLRSRVLVSPPRANLLVQRPTRAQPLELPVELAGQPIRVGLSWREDDAEPGCVIVTRVVAGSPAEASGLRVGDRLWRFGGREVDDGPTLQRLIAESSGMLEVLIERDGILRTLELQVPGDNPSAPSHTAAGR